MGEGSSRVGSFTYYSAVISVLGSTAVSLYTIFLHLKNYRRPDLQRLTIRILIMYLLNNSGFQYMDLHHLLVYHHTDLHFISTQFEMFMK